jgi:UDP:flavonoid glycosyltransferase YjiC (YdhE family)
MDSSKGKILIVTAGTRGDIQPFIALTIGLAKRGWGVGIATHGSFFFLSEYGIGTYEGFIKQNIKDEVVNSK